MENPVSATSSPLFKTALAFGIVSLLIIPLNCLVFWQAKSGTSFGLVFLLAAVQFIIGIASATMAFVHYSRTPGFVKRGWAMALGLGAMLVGFGGVVAVVLLALLLVASVAGGGAWGRPLRLRGRILHPSLRKGSDWTLGARPDASKLDAPTRAALEALWLHDAQKEHASVPAFSRISWMLAAVGAPAELLEGAHKAAMEEIDHTRRCFALAAGYGGKSHSVEAMPDLLVGGLDIQGDPLVHLATESLKDGCLLEDFNADVAAVCEGVCEEPATRDVLARIAVEERSHAEFSWAALEWLLERGGDKVRRAIERSIAEIESVPRPTSADAYKQSLADKADPVALRKHGRLRDEEWAALWNERVALTRARAEALLAGEVRQAA